jgi:hypothetical protein
MMLRLSIATSAIILGSLSIAILAQTPDIAIIKSFLTPGTHLIDLNEYDSKTGKIIASQSAILHLQMSSGSKDIAYAETADLENDEHHVLTVNVLRFNGTTYRKIFAKTYFDRVLFAQDWKTIGFQPIQLPNGKAGLMVITSAGAALGGDIEVFSWREGEGLIDVVPSKVGGGYEFQLIGGSSVSTITVSYRKSSTQTNVPPATVLTWNGASSSFVVSP